MTSYFDKNASAIASLDCIRDEDFIAEVSKIEEAMLKDVEVCINDREFPDDLCKAIRITVYKKRLSNDSDDAKHAKEMALAMRTSGLLMDLHSHFHDLARRNLKTRFGRWSDHPDGNAARIKEHDNV